MVEQLDRDCRPEELTVKRQLLDVLEDGLVEKVLEQPPVLAPAL